MQKPEAVDSRQQHWFRRPGRISEGIFRCWGAWRPRRMGSRAQVKMGVGVIGKSATPTLKFGPKFSACMDCSYYPRVDLLRGDGDVMWGVRRQDSQEQLLSQARLRSQVKDSSHLRHRSARKGSSTDRCDQFRDKFQLYWDGEQNVQWHGCIPSNCEAYPGGPVVAITNTSCQNAKRSCMPRGRHLTTREP